MIGKEDYIRAGVLIREECTNNDGSVDEERFHAAMRALGEEHDSIADKEANPEPDPLPMPELKEQGQRMADHLTAQFAAHLKDNPMPEIMPGSLPPPKKGAKPDPTANIPPGVLNNSAARKPDRFDPSQLGEIRVKALSIVRRAFERFRTDVLYQSRIVLKGMLYVNGIWDDGAPIPALVANAPSSADKLDRFRAWLRQRMGVSLVGDALLSEYIRRAHAKGAARSFNELRRGTGQGYASKSSAPIRPVGRRGSSPRDKTAKAEGFVREMMSKDATLHKVKVLAARTFTEMEDVTARMGTKISRMLADGLVQGWSPQRIAREMASEVDISLERALLITRTELVRAHAEGQLDGMEAEGTKRVTAAVEWVSADDDRVCPECAAMQDAVFAIADARGKIPAHPNCRCAWQAVSKASPAVTLGDRKEAAGSRMGVGPAKVPKPVTNAVREILGPLPHEVTVFSDLIWNARKGDFDPEKHPKAEAGSGKGGQFISTGGGDEGKSKFSGETVGKAEHVRSNEIEHVIADAITGKVLSLEDGVYSPRDVQQGKNAVEVKSLLKGEKNAISVHADALLRKVDWMQSNPGNIYHTVVYDDRAGYEGGKHADKYSGHQIYYRRGNGRWALSKMHPVKDLAELKRLVRAKDEDLPEKARGALPSDPDEIAKLRVAAEKAHAARLAKDRKRKQKLREQAIAKGAKG